MAAFTQSQYDALKEAISLGATQVEYGDKVVKYRSLSEMMALLNRMEKELGITDGGIIVTNPVYNSGLQTD